MAALPAEDLAGETCAFLAPEVIGNRPFLPDFFRLVEGFPADDRLVMVINPVHRLFSAVVPFLLRSVTVLFVENQRTGVLLILQDPPYNQNGLLSRL